MKKYIHYGANEFSPELFRLVKNLLFENKPSGGFWAEPEGTEYGWKKWCEEIGIKLESLNEFFSFTLKPNSNVIELHSADDLKLLDQVEKPIPFFQNKILPDFERMLTRVKDNSSNCVGKLQDVKAVIGNIWGIEADTNG